MIYSKVMEQSDYEELKVELEWLEEIVQLSGGWPQVQHPHRHWEYALMMKAFDAWGGFDNYKDLYIADMGGGIGFTTPFFLSLGHETSMYEPWLHGDETTTFWNMVNNVRNSLKIEKTAHLINRGLNGLVDGDRGVYDCVFCISTLEHIKDTFNSFIDLLSIVKPGGLLFLTTDYGDHELDDYPHAGLRAGKMFTKDIYISLVNIAIGAGFKLLGNKCAYDWKEEYRLVNNYGFASLALVRNK